MKVAVKIRLKKSILDPQGKAVHTALQQLGFDQIAGARIGKLIELDIDAEADAQQVQEIARNASRKLLANPVTEEFEIEVVEEQA